MRKTVFSLCENKGADQLYSNCKADQRLCFRYTNSTIPLLLKPKFQATSYPLWLHTPVCVRPGRNPKDQFSSVEAHLMVVEILSDH